MAVKNYLNLSNEFCEALGGLTKDHINKTLNPGKREKGIGPRLFDIFCELFAVEFIMRPNPAAAARMQRRYEGRNTQQIRIPPSCRISRELLEHAKQVIYSEWACSMAAAVPRDARGRYRAERRARNGNGANGHARS